MFNMGRKLFHLPGKRLIAFIPSSIINSSGQREAASTSVIPRRESTPPTPSSDEKLRDPPLDEEKDASEPIPYPSTFPEKFAALPEPEQSVLFYLGYFYCGLYQFFKEPPPDYTALSNYVINLVATHEVLCSQISFSSTTDNLLKEVKKTLKKLCELQWTEASAANLLVVRSELTKISTSGWFPLFSSPLEEKSPLVQFAKVVRKKNNIQQLSEQEKDLLLASYRLVFGNDFPINLVQTIFSRMLLTSEESHLKAWQNSLPVLQNVKNQIEKEARTLIINEKQRQWRIRNSKPSLLPAEIFTERKATQIEFSKTMEKIGWLIILNDGKTYVTTQKKMIAYGILVGFLLTVALLLTLALVYTPAGLFASMAIAGCATLAGALCGTASVKVAAATRSFRFGIFDKPSHIQFNLKPHADKEFDAAFALFRCRQK